MTRLLAVLLLGAICFSWSTSQMSFAQEPMSPLPMSPLPMSPLPASPKPALQTPDRKKTRVSPAENPPQILVASSINQEGYLVLVHYKTIFIGFEGDSYNHRTTTKVSLKDVEILTADGNEMSLDAARKLISDQDTPILVTEYNTKLPKFYAKMFTPTTLHFVFPKRAPQWQTIQEPGAPVRK